MGMVNGVERFHLLGGIKNMMIHELLLNIHLKNYNKLHTGQPNCYIPGERLIIYGSLSVSTSVRTRYSSDMKRKYPLAFTSVRVSGDIVKA